MPDADGEPGQIRRAEGRRLADDGAAHRRGQHVRLELHEEGVAARTAVDAQLAQRHAGVLLHGGDEVHALVGNGFLRGADDVLPLCAARDADDGPAGVHIPIRRAEAREGRDKIHAAGGVDLLRIILCVACLAEEAHLVAQPLDNGPADKDAALEGIGHMAAEPGCNGRDKAVAADAGRLARVHEQEAARAVGILGLAGGEAALAEQRGLLVARRARDGNFHALDVAGAEVAAARADVRQHAARDAQDLQERLVPVEAADVKEHGA